LSQGVPMLCAGDEISKTQRGNNNAYCQDNEISWLDWNLSENQKSLLQFTRKLISMRLKHPNLRRRKFYQDRTIRGSAVKDIAWYRPDSQEMTDEEWTAGWVRCLGVMLNGETLGEIDDTGTPVVDDSFLLMLNCHHEPIDFYLPPPPNGGAWNLEIDTNQPEMESTGKQEMEESFVRLAPQSLVLLCEDRPPTKVSEL